uniref:Zinc finger, CCHC-type n=1 Tax=Tanacetum cinerariifolium TaxID=118510 RepID=A0A6L2J6H8_TANCI|nr:zinc finger, CCHC-type [Tanacetum cinerariifolium]
MTFPDIADEDRSSGFVNAKVVASGIKSHRLVVVIEDRVLDQGYELFGVSRFRFGFSKLVFGVAIKRREDRSRRGLFVQFSGRSITIKVLEFFDFPGLRQGVEDLRELLHKGAQGNREAEVFQVSNDDTAVAQRRLEDKQPEEKTITDCLVKEQKNEYQTGWKIKTGNVLDSYNQRFTQQCIKSVVAKHLGVARIQQQNGLVDETNMTLFAKVRCFLIQSGLSKVFWADDTTRSTYLVNRSPSSVIGFKKPIDMNIGFNDSEEYKKTFIGPNVGTGSMQVLYGFEFEVEPLGDYTFEVEPQENVDQGAGLQEVQTQDLIDNQLARDREQHLACELLGYREDSNEAAFAVTIVEKIYAHESLTFSNTVACEVISKWKVRLKDNMDAQSDVYVLSKSCKKSKGNVLGMKIVRDQSGNTLRVSQSRFYNGKLVQTFLEGHSILTLDGSLSGDYDVEKNGKSSYIYAVGSQEYQMVCTRLDIASADVGYGLMVLRCVGSLKANLQHMEALSTTEAGYMTFTDAWKKEIWLK